MNAHIAKPIDPQKLYETLAAYIQITKTLLRIYVTVFFAF